MSKRIKSFGVLSSCLIIICGLLGWGRLSYSQENPASLKVITFNLYLLCVGPGCILRKVPDIEPRKKQIAQWLKGQNADIVFLQEVWQPEQFEYLKKESDYPYSVYFGEKSEMALLSRYPVIRSDYIPNRWQGSYVEDCKKGIVGYRYGLGLATINFNGTEIILASAHPLARRSDVNGFSETADRLTPERKTMLLEYWLNLKEAVIAKPVIFAGDFNMNYDSEEYAFFGRLFGLTDSLRNFSSPTEGNAPFCSYCEYNVYAKKQGNPSEHVIDHIFVNDFFTPISAQIDFPKPDLSDHQPIETVLQIQSEYQMPNPKQTPGPTTNEIGQLIQYFETVSFSPYCYLSWELGYKQRSRVLQFLKEREWQTH